MSKKGDAMKFLLNSLTTDQEECIPWPFTRSYQGRAIIIVDGKRRPASRVVCGLVHGVPKTEDMQAAHSCGKGHEGCINHKHISWKTPRENTLDKFTHGTMLMGERHPIAKLKASEVIEIRRLYKPRVRSYQMLAEMFGVKKALIYKIVKKRLWKSLDNVVR